MTDTPPAPEAIYRQRAADFTARRDQISQHWNLIGNLRLLLFVLAIVAAVLALRGQPFVFGIVCLILLIVFAVLVHRHRQLGRERHALAVRAEINEEALHRLAREWDALPLRDTTEPPPDHPYAADLDLFGHASLRHLLGEAMTPMGDQTLDGWLLAPPPADQLGRRGPAIADLADRIAFRETLIASARELPQPAPDPEPLLKWAEGQPWLVDGRWLRWFSWLSPAALVLSIVAEAAGLIAGPLWIVFVGINVIVSYSAGSEAYQRLDAVARHHGTLHPFAASFAAISGERFTAPLLVELQQQLEVGGETASQQLSRLDRLAARVIPRSAMVYPLIQALTLWDIHLLGRLEHWQRVTGPSLRSWLAMLGEIEALANLATLAHDNPAWAPATIDPAATEVTARAIAHPLLPADGRIANDVTVGPPGTFLLVTGSNMSGKSTLLRALGVNIVLANTGAPICADTLTLPPLALWTSIRVADSLERGVSFFMAELQRLKLVVDAANQWVPEQPRIFYLLDEMLQGTNTGERAIAARRIIATLVERGALGAVTTHDLSLASTPPLREMARPVHFSETITQGVNDQEMSFDYRLRPGLATSTNALKLLELVGFELTDTVDGKTEPPANEAEQTADHEPLIPPEPEAAAQRTRRSS